MRIRGEHILISFIFIAIAALIGLIIYVAMQETLEERATTRLEEIEQEKEQLFAKWDRRDISPYQMVEEMQKLQEKYKEFGEWVIAEIEGDTTRR